MKRRIYLDWNATAPLRPEAREAMVAALDVLGNPSSVHAEGRAARAIVEHARGQVAEAVGCKPAEVVFTSGATEAARVLAPFAETTGVCVDGTAHDALWVHHSPGGSDQVCAMGLANSETGIITEPEVTDAGPDASSGALLVDATQAIGRIPWSFAWSGADFAVLSAHKLGGPKGIGALIVRDGVDIQPLARGGGQEMGRRSGTENVPAIAGFGAACAAAMRDLDAGVWMRVKELRNILEKTLAGATKETNFIGKEAERLPNTSCFTTPGWKGETQVMVMDLAGFAISSGSACSSGKVRESRVLRSMGYDAPNASSAVRVSLGPTTTEDEVMRFAQAWLDALERFRRKAA
ncbi:MAG: cysteine desulfurase family protein [Pseudomonadota bacterium]